MHSEKALSEADAGDGRRSPAIPKGVRTPGAKRPSVPTISFSGMRLLSLAAIIAAPAALLLSPGRAKAILTYNIFESNGNVEVQTSGFLFLPTAPHSSNCSVSGLFDSAGAFICTGNDPGFLNQNAYLISGPTSIGTGPAVAATSVVELVRHFLALMGSSLSIKPTSIIIKLYPELSSTARVLPVWA